MRKRLVLLQALAILIAVFQYGLRATGQDEGRNSSRILSNIFYPYLTARYVRVLSSVVLYFVHKNMGACLGSLKFDGLR